MTISDHWCTPPDYMHPDKLNINLTEWKKMFLPQELDPYFQVKSCKKNCAFRYFTVQKISLFRWDQANA